MGEKHHIKEKKKPKQEKTKPAKLTERPEPVPEPSLVRPKGSKDKDK